MMRTKWIDCLNAIENANCIAVFMHKSVDGDAVGSAYALAAALRRSGKAVCVFMGEECPDDLKFLMDEDIPTVTTEVEKFNAAKEEGAFDLAIALDCATADRMSRACKEVFLKIPKSIRIDHHLPCEGSDFADIIAADPKWAAASEGLWDFLKMYCDGKRCPLPDRDVAIKLYTGILTDTGRFVYSCTTGNTLRTVAELVDITGTDLNWIARSLFDVKPERVTRLLAESYNKAERFFEGKVTYLYLSLADFEKAGALSSDSNAIPPALMNVMGTEIAVFAREIVRSDGSVEIKVSMRSTTDYNVAAICNIFGGGGHACASGCSICEDSDTVRKMILDEIGKIMD